MSSRKLSSFKCFHDSHTGKHDKKTEVEKLRSLYNQKTPQFIIRWLLQDGYI